MNGTLNWKSLDSGQRDDLVLETVFGYKACGGYRPSDTTSPSTNDADAFQCIKKIVERDELRVSIKHVGFWRVLITKEHRICHGESKSFAEAVSIACLRLAGYHVSLL